jgi:hypothetical protein
MQPDTMSLPANVAAIDRALDRLRQPTTVHDRLAILQELIEFWHGPIRPEDGMTDAEMTSQLLPLPLRWWYRFAGKRSEIMSGQNILFVPRDFQNKHRMLRIMNGRLFFYVENQGVYQWSTQLEGDDPPVFGRYEGRGRWAKEGVTLVRSRDVPRRIQCPLHVGRRTSVARHREADTSARRRTLAVDWSDVFRWRRRLHGRARERRRQWNEGILGVDRRKNAGTVAVSEAAGERQMGARKAVKSLWPTGALRNTHRCSAARHSLKITTP